MSYDFPAHESTRKRRRWGCTCGCVMLLVVLIIAGGLLSYVGLRPHADYSRYALMDGEVDGFGVLRINAEDEGVNAFSNFFLNRLETAYRSNPEDATKAKTLDAINKVSKNVMAHFFQGESMIYATYNPVTADENILISVPLENRMASLPLRVFLQEVAGLQPSGSEGAGRLYPLGTGESNGTTHVLALTPSEMMISDDEPLLRKSVGYARESNRVAVPADNLQWFIDQLSLDNPPEGEDLAFALVNEESRIINLILTFEDVVGITGIADRIGSALATADLSLSDLSGLKLTADLSSADELKGQLTLYCPDATMATRLAQVFTASLPHITGNTSRHGFTLEATAAARGRTTVINMQLTGLKAWVEGLVPIESEVDETPAATNKVPAIAVETE